jgi:glutamate---cysteine ligase / carboxylate-amine ligase
VSTRTVGVEEELILVDPETFRLTSVSQGAVQIAQLAGDGASDDIESVEEELYRPQIETATPPCATLADLDRHVRRARGEAAAAAAESGAAMVAVPLPVLDDDEPRITPKPRYERIVSEFGEIGRNTVVGGMHVHVAIESDDEGVGVIDRIRPWLPVLLAVSANSPYSWGVDTGYASWRSQTWSRWPSAGPPEEFGDAAGYRAATEALVETGAAIDAGMIYFDARLAQSFPTIEVRIADVCTEVGDALLVAGLTRALVTTAAEAWSRGGPTPGWRAELVRAATWRAGRDGLSDKLVHPETGHLVRARDAVDALITHVSDALDDAGDREQVERLLSDLLSRGPGAGRQRAVFESKGTLEAVVDDLRDRTEASYADSL